MKVYVITLTLSLSAALSFSQDTTGTVVVLSEKVGPIIDLEERNFYKFFMGVKHFESAILLQRPDSSYVFKVISRNETEPSVELIWMPIVEEEVYRLRLHIDPDYRSEDQRTKRSDSHNDKSSVEKRIEEPAYRSRFITEFGYSYQITPPMKSKSVETLGTTFMYSNEWWVTGRHYLTSELGYIHNFNAKYGLGVTHFTGWDVGHNLRRGLKLRIRRWINPKTSLDLSVGSILWGGGWEIKLPGLAGDVGMNFHNTQTVYVTIEALKIMSNDYSYYPEEGGLKRGFSLYRRNVGVYIGYKLGSKKGLVFHGLALAGVVSLFLLFVSFYPGD